MAFTVTCESAEGPETQNYPRPGNAISRQRM